MVGWLALGGTVAGAVACGILFGFLIPPDRGEEDVVWIMPAYGAFAGFVAVIPAILGFWVGLVSWTRTSARSVSSRAAVATASASGAALLFWVATVTAANRGYGIVLGLFLGGLTAVVTAAIAGPTTVRAARRADRDAAGRFL
ncbi:MAG: hypothetical protein IJO71_01020 [Microbacterium sp.]|uniref:hypothetical protein n=1 Tax=Microbacterium sp. TaxID=51671 RepID=UPI0025CDA2A7|nr:hypothetical protein [Microbacterium sp.]MBQ9915765.1 hypothetical protein [Microbacterium sp.]